MYGVLKLLIITLPSRPLSYLCTLPSECVGVVYHYNNKKKRDKKEFVILQAY